MGNELMLDNVKVQLLLDYNAVCGRIDELSEEIGRIDKEMSRADKKINSRFTSEAKREELCAKYNSDLVKKLELETEYHLASLESIKIEKELMDLDVEEAE